MLYFIYGSNSFNKKELKKIREALLKKRPDALSFQFSEEIMDLVNVSELAQGKGLFEERFLVEFDKLFVTEVFAGKEKETLSEMKRSENIFFVLEEKLPKKTLDLIKEFAERTAEEKRAGEPKKDFTAFSLADALGERNKQKLWMLIREVVARNYSIEEIYGILFWQMKLIVLAYKTSTASEAGVSPFPYNKAKKFTQNFTLREAEALLHDLTTTLLEAREKNIPLEHSLERFALNL